MMNAVSSSTLTSASFASSPMGNDDLFALGRKQPAELAREFEGLFVSMLVKQLRQSSESGAGLFPGDPSDTYGGMFDMYMGRHLAESGGIGMAQFIQSAIEKQAQ